MAQCLRVLIVLTEDQGFQGLKVFNVTPLDASVEQIENTQGRKRTTGDRWPCALLTSPLL